MEAITSKKEAATPPFLVFPDPKSKTMGELYLHGTGKGKISSTNNSSENKRKREDDGNGGDDNEDDEDGNGGGGSDGFGQRVIIEGKMYG